eukprot:931754-Alexandrium_andersonii.AAC.1
MPREGLPSRGILVSPMPVIAVHIQLGIPSGGTWDKADRKRAREEAVPFLLTGSEDCDAPANQAAICGDRVRGRTALLLQEPER